MDFKSCGKPIDSLLERVLSVNIQNSDYFKELYRVKTFEEAVDEIYEHVSNVEPWMTGNLRGPSTAFCLLYKLFTLDLDGKQVQILLDHEDSPYIRALGFLFLRYNADPKTLWQWLEPYLQDEEEFSPGVNKKPTTMGVFIRDLLLGQYYYDSLLPRIPVPVIRQVAGNLESMNLPKEPSGVVASASRLGADGDGARRPPSVKAALSVAFGQRAPHRAATRESSPIRRGMGPGRDEPRNGSDKPRGSDRARDDKKPRGRDGDLDSEVERSRNRSRDGHVDRDLDRGGERSREYDRDRDRDRGRGGGRDRDRDYGRDRDQDRYRDRDRDRGRDRDGDRDRDRDRGRDRDRERDGDYRSRDRGRDREHDRSGRRDSSRERSSERGRSSRGRDADKDRQAPEEPRPSRSPAGAVNLQKLKEMYGDVTAKDKKAELGSRGAKDSTADDVIRLGGPTWR